MLDEADGDKYYYIQQALHKVNKLSTSYRAIDATIWLTSGDHFFFQCDKTVEYVLPSDAAASTSTSSSSGYHQPLRGDVLCSVPSLRSFFPQTDNVNLTIRALRCESSEAKDLEKSKSDYSWFFEVCSKAKDNELVR